MSNLDNVDLHFKFLDRCAWNRHLFSDRAAHHVRVFTLSTWDKGAKRAFFAYFGRDDGRDPEAILDGETFLVLYDLMFHKNNIWTCNNPSAAAIWLMRQTWDEVDEWFSDM
jgi:hypothetical protein